jgi:hypothetical protein
VRWLCGVLLAIALLADPRLAAADQEVLGDRFGLQLPDGFLPTPSAPAREAAAPLRDLLEVLGQPALGSRRVYQRLRGNPQDPEASFVARRFILRAEDTTGLGRLSDDDLADAWRRFAAGRKDHMAFAPRRRTVGGYGTLEVGGMSSSPLGMTRWERFLVIPSEDDILILHLTAAGGDRHAWDKSWEVLVGSLRLEPRPQRTHLVPIVFASIGLGALLMAGALALLRRMRPLHPKPGSRPDDASHRPPPRAVADVRTTLLPTAIRLRSGADQQPVAPAPHRWAEAPLSAQSPQGEVGSPGAAAHGDHDSGRVPGGDGLELALARRMAELEGPPSTSPSRAKAH